MCEINYDDELLQLNIVRSFWASLGKVLFKKECHQDAVKRRRLIIALEQTIIFGKEGRGHLGLQVGQS